MTTDTLLAISGTVILGLLCILGWFLAGWRTKMGDDAASTSRTNYITYSNATNALQEVKIEINETDSPINFNVPAGYSDYSGNAFKVTQLLFNHLVH